MGKDRQQRRRERAEAEILGEAEESLGADDREMEIGMEGEPSPEEAAGEVGESGLSRRVAELEEENAELRDKLMRALADLENTRKRAGREKEAARRYAKGEFARALLPVSDSLSRALEMTPEAARRQDETLDKFMTGVEMAEKEFLKRLEEMGVTRIAPGEEKFDPNWHEVMFEAEKTGKPPGTIVQIIEHGFMIADRLLRPARVVVAKNDGSWQPGGPGPEEGGGEGVDTHV